LRVLIDGYFIEKPYGFGRFIGELCQALGASGSSIEFIVAVPDRVNGAALLNYPNLTWHLVPDANFVIWEQFIVPRLARRLSCDVIHFPYNTKALNTYSIPAVTTVHDVLFLKDKVSIRIPKDYIAARYAKLIFQTATIRSAAIISVSKTTERALLDLAIKSRTVYNTVDGFTAKYKPGVKAVEGRPYLLHRGGYSPHRNTLRVIQAFQETHAELGDVDLKIIGAPLGAERWQTQGDPSIQFLPRVTDQELATLYSESECVVATSLEEGFCLPIIEGFGFGVPVITSNVDPMREIAGAAAILVNPASVAEIGRAMASVVADAALARSLVERGHDRMQEFSSVRVAEQMIEVYSEIARKTTT
jgi:glycosyltransferase involved in cell wall biosynthesis